MRPREIDDGDHLTGNGPEPPARRATLRLVRAERLRQANVHGAAARLSRSHRFESVFDHVGASGREGRCPVVGPGSRAVAPSPGGAGTRPLRASIPIAGAPPASRRFSGVASRQRSAVGTAIATAMAGEKSAGPGTLAPVPSTVAHYHRARRRCGGAVRCRRQGERHRLVRGRLDREAPIRTRGRSAPTARPRARPGRVRRRA